jgi:hypothetical protein
MVGAVMGFVCLGDVLEGSIYLQLTICGIE